MANETILVPIKMATVIVGDEQRRLARELRIGLQELPQFAGVNVGVADALEVARPILAMP